MDQNSGLLIQISAEYERLRTLASDRADYYYQLAMRSAAFRNAEDKLKSLTVDVAREEYAVGKGTGSEKKLASLRAEQEKATAARKAALHKLGIKEKDLKPQYSCKKCKDTGFVGLKPCACYKKKLAQIVLERVGATVTLPSFTQDNADKSETLEKLYAKMKDYCNKFPDVKIRNFLFFGKTGTGKSYLAGCMARELTNRGYNAIFLSSFALGNLMLKYHTSFSSDRNLYLDIVNTCDFLVIDDLGAEPVLQNVTNEYLLGIITERLRQGKHTVVTTNLTPEEIQEKYNDRIFSRLTEKKFSRAVEFPEDNLR